MGYHQNDWQVFDDRGVRKYLDSNERVRFLAAADKLNLGDRALCYVIAYTGCRISEALQLGPHLVDHERQAVRFRTLKQRRMAFRHVPVPPWLITMLTKLPCDAAGRFWPIHRSTGWRIVHHAMQAANVVGPMATCKGLRHAFGIHAAISNVPGPTIQKSLGHASPATTAIYLDAVGIEERALISRMW